MDVCAQGQQVFVGCNRLGLELSLKESGGHDSQHGLIYVLNNRGDDWRGEWVNTKWSNASFSPVAWWGKHDLHRSADPSTNADGRAQFFAPARGYAVYALK